LLGWIEESIVSKFLDYQNTVSEHLDYHLIE
jgi:hypothetical protein